MLSVVVFFFVLSVGSLWGSMKFKCRIERIVAVWILSIVLIVYVAGLSGLLKYGPVFILFLCFLQCMDLISMKEDLKQYFYKYVMTSGILLFFVFSAVIIMACHGKYADSWDEFTHWMDAVKVMASLNDFITDQASFSAFPTYPPAMAVFQYFFQKIFQFFHSGMFSEWRMYVAYQVFFLSMLAYFFDRLSLKKPLLTAAYLIPMILMPLFYFQNCYSVIFIDPFLGIAAGAGMAAVYLEEKYDRCYFAFITLLCPVLVLVKDVGFLLAVLIASVYMADMLMNKPAVRHRYLTAGLPFFMTFLAKISWKVKLYISGRGAGYGVKNIDAAEYLRMFFAGEGKSEFAQSVTDQTWDAFFQPRIEIPHIGVSCSYFSIWIVLVFLTAVLDSVMIRKNMKHTGSLLFISGGAVLLVIFYAFSMGAVYIANFSEYEASILASYNRYMNIVFLPVTMMVLLGFLKCLSESDKNSIYRIIAAAGMIYFILISDLQYMGDYVTGKLALQSKYFREPYELFSDAIQKQCANSKVFFISQGNNGQDYFVCRYNVRPVTQFGDIWSIGTPVNETDRVTVPMTQEEWWDQLIKDGYGYAAIYNISINDSVTENFKNNYGDLFGGRENVRDKSVYYIDRQNKLLRIVEQTE